MGFWKWVGLAGIAGVAAGGAAIARRERERRAYTPDELATLLRHAGIDGATISTHLWFRLAVVKVRERPHA